MGPRAGLSSAQKRSISALGLPVLTGLLTDGDLPTTRHYGTTRRARTKVNLACVVNRISHTFLVISQYQSGPNNLHGV
jgi:hypothetical protein